MESVHPNLSYPRLPPVVPPSRLSIELQSIPSVIASDRVDVARLANELLSRVIVVDDADAALKRLNKAIESEYDKLVNAAPAQMESLEARIASLDKRAAEIIRRRAEAKMDRSASEHEAAVRRARELLKGR